MQDERGVARVAGQERPALAFILVFVATIQTAEKRHCCVEERTLLLDGPQLCDLGE